MAERHFNKLHKTILGLQPLFCKIVIARCYDSVMYAAVKCDRQIDDIFEWVERWLFLPVANHILRLFGLQIFCSKVKIIHLKLSS